MSEKSKASVFICALVAILVADARRKGAVGDLYLGSIKLPDYGFRFWMLEGHLPMLTDEEKEFLCVPPRLWSPR